MRKAVNSPHELPRIDNGLTCHLGAENFFRALPQKSLESFQPEKPRDRLPRARCHSCCGSTLAWHLDVIDAQVKLSTTARGAKTFSQRTEKADGFSACKQRLQASRAS